MYMFASEPGGGDAINYDVSGSRVCFLLIQFLNSHYFSQILFLFRPKKYSCVFSLGGRDNARPDSLIRGDSPSHVNWGDTGVADYAITQKIQPITPLRQKRA